jgi:hypothetical protein
MHIVGSFAASPAMFWPAALTFTWWLIPYEVESVAADKFPPTPPEETIARIHHPNSFLFINVND